MIDSGSAGFLTTQKIKQWHKVPHHTKFFREYTEYGITLTGGPDDIFEATEKTFIIPDYKTAKYTENQDKLAPMYQVQLNCYKEIAEVCSFSPVSELSLIYFEPVTDDKTATERWTLQGMKMDFMAKAVPVDINRDMVHECLKRTRIIYDTDIAPRSREGCPDCGSLNNIITLLSETPPL